MKRLSTAVGMLIVCFACSALAELEDVLIKASDDGVKTSQQQDYMEAVMNAQLQAVEKSGVDVSSIRRIESFTDRKKAVEKQVEAVLAPGFQIIDMGYQQDGTYQVVFSGKVHSQKGNAQTPAVGEAVQKVLDRLPDLLADNSDESTRRIDGVLELLPDGFPVASNKLTRLARVRSLALEIHNALPNGSYTRKPVKLVIPEQGGLYYEKGSNGGFIGYIENSYIQYSEGPSRGLGKVAVSSSSARHEAVAAYQAVYDADMALYERFHQPWVTALTQLDQKLRELRSLDIENTQWPRLYDRIVKGLGEAPTGLQ